jgi:uncharacterized delta-60 repeat protein
MVGTDAYMAVARYDTAGQIDTTFGDEGIATHNVIAAGAQEQAKGIVVQSNGGVVISGTVEHDAGGTDLDIATLRFDENGDLDTMFGTDGVAITDLGVGNATQMDNVHGVAVDGTDRIVLFGWMKGEGREDRDRFVARLTAEGDPDTAFNTTGVYRLDVDALMQNDTGRNGIVQADGKILSAGYSSIGGRNQVVLVRLNDDGTPDNTFAGDGVLRFSPFALGMAEAYAAAPQASGSYVTTGYGRTAESGTVDLVSFRVPAAGGFDPQWGVNGAYLLDVAAQDDRGRNLVVLPDDRVVMVGSLETTADNVDAMIAVLGPNGMPDATWSSGEAFRAYEFDQPEEALYGVALSPDHQWVAAAGYLTDGDGTGTDDALLVVLPVGD